MGHGNWRCFVMVLLMTLAGFFMVCGCNSGEKVVDEVTGNRAVKQFEKSKRDIGKIADQQAERYGNVPGDDPETDEQ